MRVTDFILLKALYVFRALPNIAGQQIFTLKMVAEASPYLLLGEVPVILQTMMAGTMELPDGAGGTK